MNALKSIYMIDNQINELIGIIDFIPNREERLILKNKEYKVGCIIHVLEQNAVLVMVDIVQPYYANKIKDLKW